jgi:hypothetical protein
MKLESSGNSDSLFKSESLPNYPSSHHHHHAGLQDFQQLQNQGLSYMHDPHVHPAHYQQYFSSGGLVENWGGFHGGYL